MKLKLAPTATIDVVCGVCQRTFHVSRYCTGATGSCPWCGQGMQIPGQAIHPNLWAMHYAYFPVRWYRQSLLWTIIGCILNHRMWYSALGGGGWPVWNVLVWSSVMLLALMTIPRICVILVYYRFSGRDWTKDRERFSRAGGDDISLWIPLLGFYALFLVYSRTMSGFEHDPLHFVRTPWTFALISLLLNTSVSVLTASVLFRVRFGPSGDSERPPLF
jgi:hypothetical protein